MKMRINLHRPNIEEDYVMGKSKGKGKATFDDDKYLEGAELKPKSK